MSGSVLTVSSRALLEFLSWHAPTVGEALIKVSNYFPLINSAVRLPIAIGDGRVTLGVEAPSNPALVTRPYAEYTLAAIYLRTRFATEEPYRLIEVNFSQPRPASVGEHERIFGCPVNFGAEACQMVIARDVWDSKRHGPGSHISIVPSCCRPRSSTASSTPMQFGRARGSSLFRGLSLRTGCQETRANAHARLRGPGPRRGGSDQRDSSREPGGPWEGG